MNRKIKFMATATRIRLSRGEELEAILSGWLALSEEEKNEIRKAVQTN